MLGVVAGAWASYRIYAAPARDAAARYFAELDGARRSLDGAIERAGELERRIDEATGLARRIEGTIGEAIVGAGRIADASRRAVYLVSVIRNVVDGLRSLYAEGPH